MSADQQQPDFPGTAHLPQNGDSEPSRETIELLNPNVRYLRPPVGIPKGYVRFDCIYRRLGMLTRDALLALDPATIPSQDDAVRLAILRATDPNPKSARLAADSLKEWNDRVDGKVPQVLVQRADAGEIAEREARLKQIAVLVKIVRKVAIQRVEEANEREGARGAATSAFDLQMLADIWELTKAEVSEVYDHDVSGLKDEVLAAVMDGGLTVETARKR